MNKKVLKADRDAIANGVNFIQESLKARDISKRKIAQTLLTSEEVLAKILESAPAESNIVIEIRGHFGNLAIQIKSACEVFAVSDIYENLRIDEFDEDAGDVIRKLYDKLFADTLSIRNSRGKTTVTFPVKKSPYSSLVYTIAALVLGILTGFLIHKLFPAAVGKNISTIIITPIYTMFINFLKMIVAPLVFFSVAYSIADFTDLKALGRIAFEMVIFYLMTSVIAIFVGYFTYQLFPIGNTDLAMAVSEETAESTLQKAESVTISIKDTLVGIIPSDIITPFQKSDMLQLIFLAVIFGVAAASLAGKMPEFKRMLGIFNAVFSKITSVIVKLIPIVVFCSMAKMMIAMDFGTLLNVFVWTPVVYFGDILMIGVYIILLAAFAGLAPHKFLKKYFPAMVSAFTCASSNAALPTSIERCDKMGISPKIYSFSLPLGATINMDGSCISLLISALFCAKIFQIPVTPSVLLSLFISIMVLSVGSPGVPGGNLVCIALLIPQIGVPAEAISLIMGLYPLVGMMQTCTNVTGDAVVSTIVAKREGLLDTKKFNS